MPPPIQFFKPAVAMQSYFGIIEDDASVYTPDTLFTNPDLFTPIYSFKPSKSSSIFWISTQIQSPVAINTVLSFKHLTYVDLYIKPDMPGARYAQQFDGAFRPKDQISPGDSRFHFNVRLEAGVTYHALIRIRHTKQYRPAFDFRLNSQNHYNKAQQQREMVDFWFQGGALFLLLYGLLSWFNTHYRPSCG